MLKCQELQVFLPQGIPIHKHENSKKEELVFSNVSSLFEYCMLYQFEGIWSEYPLSISGILANLDLRCKESQFIWWFRYQQYQIKSDKRSWKKTGLFTEQPMFVVAGKTPSESLYSDLKYVNPMWNSGFSSTSKPPEPFLQWSISMGTVC